LSPFSQNNYVSHHIMAHDPFVSLDLGGVGAMMHSAVTRIRSHKESVDCKVRTIVCQIILLPGSIVNSH